MIEQQNALLGYLVGYRDMLEQVREMIDQMIARFGGIRKPPASGAPPSNQQPAAKTKPERPYIRNHIQEHVLDLLRTASQPLCVSKIRIGLGGRGVDRSDEQVKGVLERNFKKGVLVRQGREGAWMYSVAPSRGEH